MDHDQLFKEILKQFFHEFMLLFFPEQAEAIDFRRVRFHSLEVFTEYLQGDEKRLDVAVEAPLKSGDAQWVWIHIETELRRRGTQPLRSFRYFAALRLRREEPIFPIVIYLRGPKREIHTETYREETLGLPVLDFHFQAVNLAGLSAWEFLKTGKPLAAALSALMDSRGGSRAALKARGVQAVVKSRLAEAKRLLLLNCLESYLELGRQERHEYDRLLAEPENEEVSEMADTYFTKLHKEGVREGRKEGRVESVLDLARIRFGRVPRTVSRRVKAASDEEELSRIMAEIVAAKSPSDLTQ